MAKKPKAPPGTWFEREMYRSAAYHALRGWSAKLLVLFLDKRHFRVVGRTGKEQRICLNCDDLLMTYVELESEYGMTIPRIARAFDELLAKGFIKVVDAGGAYQKHKSVYALVDDWKNWRPGIIFRTRDKSAKRGWQRSKKKQ